MPLAAPQPPPHANGGTGTREAGSAQANRSAADLLRQQLNSFNRVP